VAARVARAAEVQHFELAVRKPLLELVLEPLREHLRLFHAPPEGARITEARDPKRVRRLGYRDLRAAQAGGVDVHRTVLVGEDDVEVAGDPRAKHAEQLLVGARVSRDEVAGLGAFVEEHVAVEDPEHDFHADQDQRGHRHDLEPPTLPHATRSEIVVAMQRLRSRGFMWRVQSAGSTALSPR
jgi:hypothetical protein